MVMSSDILKNELLKIGVNTHGYIILLKEREISDKVINSAQDKVFRALCETVKKNMFHDSKEFPD